MVPSHDHFVNEIMRCIKRMLNYIIDTSQIIDFEGTLKDNEKYGHFLIKYIS